MELRLNEQGLIPAIAQDDDTGQVLMLGWMSPGTLKRTLEGGDVWFYSRSREDLWHKGEVSGNYLRLRSAWADCDGDALLLKVSPTGPACHTGQASCFHNPLTSLPSFVRQERGSGVLEQLFATIRQRQRDLPPDSYTARLFREGRGRIAQKVVEEAGETAVAALEEGGERLAQEAADLVYHLLVLLAASGTTPEAVWQALRQRAR